MASLISERLHSPIHCLCNAYLGRGYSLQHATMWRCSPWSLLSVWGRMAHHLVARISDAQITISLVYCRVYEGAHAGLHSIKGLKFIQIISRPYKVLEFLPFLRQVLLLNS